MRDNLIHDLECCYECLCGECSLEPILKEHGGRTEKCTMILTEEASNAIKELLGRKPFLGDVSTKELAEELSIRDGVEETFVDPYENYTIDVNGPVIVLKVYD